MNFFYKQTNVFVIAFLALIVFCSVLPQAFASNQFSPNTKQANLFSNNPLTIAINRTSFPYHAVNKQGEVIGLMPDLWRLWAKKQNVDINFVVMNWGETLEQVAEGKVDIHGGLSITDLRKKDFLFTTPLFSIYTHFYVNKALNSVSSFSDLAPYTIGVVKGSSHVEYLIDNHPELTLKMFESRHDLYNAALNNEIFVFTGLEKLADNFDGYLQLKHRFPIHKLLRIEQSQYGAAVAKTRGKLQEFINHGFSKISRKEQSYIERKWLALDKQKDSLLVTFSIDYPPYVGLSPSGEAQGLLIDVWRLWSEQVGIPVEFIPRDIIEGLGLVETKKADVALFYPTNKSTPPGTLFTKPMYEARGQVFINKKITGKNGHQLNSLADLGKELEKHTFGIWEESTLKEQLLEQYPRLNLQYFNSVSAMLTAAENNEISGMIAFADLMQAKLVKANLQTLFYSVETHKFAISLAPVIHSDNKRLMQIINQGLEELDLKALINIENNWLQASQGEFYFKRKSQKALLTESEKEYIASAKDFKLGVIRNLSPIEFVNDKNKFSGINADFIKLISERTELGFNEVIFETWNDAYNALLADEIDLLGNITKTAERERLLLFTDSYWKLPWGVVHHQILGRQTKLEDFYGKKIAIVKGSYLINLIMENYPNIEFKVVDNREQAITELQHYKVDGYMTSIASAAHLLRQEQNINLMMSVIEGVNENKSHFGVGQKLGKLKTIINKGLLTISEKEKQKIYDKWLTIEIKTGLDRVIVWQNAAKVGGVVLVILVLILLWNRRLKREVKYRQMLEKKMKHMATHDELTGLENRVLLQDRLDNAIEFHQRQSLKLAVLFIDLDGFKIINDTYGHDIGDELLQQVAQRFQGCVRSSDTVVRFGGDEFVLLLTGLHTIKEASNVAEKVLKVIQKEFQLSKANVEVGCSIGISIYPDDANNTRDLLKISDTLMYKVKTKGKNHYMFN